MTGEGLENEKYHMNQVDIREIPKIDIYLNDDGNIHIFVGNV